MKKYLFHGLCLITGLLGFQMAHSQNTLKDVFAPVIVGIPPSDAYTGLSLMPDGEIRHYNYGQSPSEDYQLCLSSKDGGLTWKTVCLSLLTRDLPYADQRSPLSQEYVRIFCTEKNVYAMRTEGGLEGGRSIVKIDDKRAIMNKPPIFIRGGKRIISGTHRPDGSGAFVYYSDDDGRSWKASTKVNAPPHVKGGFHKGTRWNHGAVEPTILELSDGRLWMIMRTAQDRHYQSFSEDGGETWSEAVPSPFYGTITMPTLLRLSDGRILFFWCNTTPLPELPTATGVWDDVFTNRDVLHVAISEDDGKTWRGFRELLLNGERNSPNFGNTSLGEDKSVHQVQALEVAPGKVLASAGQNKQCRRMVLFDVAWLYENERSCDFSEGLSQWSAFRYYKGIVGHCSYNRQAEPLLIPHPDRPQAYALRIGYTPNDSLVQDNDGALWNFPASPNGKTTLRIRFPEGAQQVDLVLNDRWFNPTDTVARYEAMYVLPLHRERLKITDEDWHEVTVSWQKNKAARVFVDGKRRGSVALNKPTEHGVSYLHLIGGHTPDNKGVWIEHVSAKREE